MTRLVHVPYLFLALVHCCGTAVWAQESGLAYSVSAGGPGHSIQIQSEMQRISHEPTDHSETPRPVQVITYVQTAIEKARAVTGQTPGLYVFASSDKLRPFEQELLSDLQARGIGYQVVVPSSESVAISMAGGDFRASSPQYTDQEGSPVETPGLANLTEKIERPVTNLFGESEAPVQPGSWWKSVYSRPTRGELYQGISLAISNGVIAGSIWFSFDGVSPWVASAMTAGITFYELIFSTHIRTYDNIVGGFSTKKERHKLSFEDSRSWKEIAIRFAHSTFMSYLWRALGGAVGSAHSILTLQGNVEILVNGLAKFPGYWLGSAKSHNLSRMASAWVGFPLFLLGPVLSKLDLFGVKMLDLVHLDPIAIGDLIIYQPSLPIMGLALLYGATAALVHWGPPQIFETFATNMDSLSSKSGAALKSVMEQFQFRSALTSWKSRLSRSCRSLLLNQSIPPEMKESL